MKIGLVTIFHVNNHGSVLQAFATQEIIKKLGHECVIINFKYPNEWHFKRGTRRVSNFKKIIRLLGLKPYHRKENKLNKFRTEHLNLSKEYKNYTKLCEENWETFDAFIVGSDQVWNPRFTHGDKTFLLTFVPNEIPKLSFASSFAQEQLDTNYLSIFSQELSKFRSISVREQNGIDIINNQLNITKPVFVSLDPTLLFSRQEWFNMLNLQTCKERKPYILIYRLTYSFDPGDYFWNVVKVFKEKYNFEVFALSSYTKPENACGVEMKDKSDASIKDFVNLFANASMVITNSFHGTAFSLNFGVPLISILSYENDDRLKSLLVRVNATSSMLKVGDHFTDDLETYRHDVRIQLNNIRKENYEWLALQLSSLKNKALY